MKSAAELWIKILIILNYSNIFKKTIEIHRNLWYIKYN